MSKGRKSALVPTGIMHKPATMAWAQLTQLKEHKELAEKNLQIIDNKKMKKESIPISRATTELRRAYPYIFDCLAYAQTHNPRKITKDDFFSSFNMPYHVFLDYCLDGCTEQTQYLKKEIYRLWGKKDDDDKKPDAFDIRYININGTEFLGRPIDISLIRTDLTTKKDKRIANIGQDKKVEYVHIHVLNGLLDTSHGHLNQPKAFYAKIRRIYDTLKRECNIIFNNVSNYMELIVNSKQTMLSPITAEQAKELIEIYKDQDMALDELEQGGFHSVFLAFEYILARKKRGTKKQDYSLLDLCEKCKPELIQVHNGILYFKDKEKVSTFFTLLTMFVAFLQNEKAVGIKNIMIGIANKNNVPFTVYFE
jgi:hypothetical protein